MNQDIDDYPAAESKSSTVLVHENGHSGESALNPTHFDDFDIDDRILPVLEEQGIIEPTPVQAKAIPVALEGRDLVAVAQTGTGKTLGFTLPSLTRLADRDIRRNGMLVLVPTRELCIQVDHVVREIGKALGIRSVAVYGGVGYGKQTDALKKGAGCIVATPGRLLDHMEQGTVRLDSLKILVLDEADRMLDMGFLPDITRIIEPLPRDRQTLMFSATFPPEIERLAKRFMRDPERVSVGAISKPVETVRQHLYPVRDEDKIPLLVKLLEDPKITSALIFLRTKDRTDQLMAVLTNRGLDAEAIHGDRSQKDRQKALDKFRNGKVRFLVATDVAARGLDIDAVSHVFNYDIPLSPDDYIHRIGRTARAQADGDAVTFVTPQEYKPLEALERALGHNIPRVDWERAPRVLSLFHPPGSLAAKAAKARRRRR